ncbi:hypothetical protein EMPG_15572 [Blastomyces silverae]|uniref:Uncharacterized protein n=1 Tax=Blastomyces silverae TaxID=2060906 RepID=A0A0H1BCD7_9EURO|nr:hypothetical protein EMPG_15572 [Blastomyces silverae]
MSVKSIVFLASMVFAIMATATKRLALDDKFADFGRLVDLPRAAAENAVVDSPRGLGSQGFFGKIVARQETITVTATATADSCGPFDPVTSDLSQVSEIQSATSSVPVPVSSNVPISSASEALGSSVDPIGISSTAVSSNPAVSVTPSASTPVASETGVAPPIETNFAVRNGGLEGAILVGAAGFAALVAL